MALPSGLAAQIGFKQEVTWGTYVAPTRFLEFVDEGIALDAQRIEGKGLRTGNRVQRADRWGQNKKGVGGPVTMEVLSKGFGLIFENMLGVNTITTPGGGTLSRLHTCKLGSLVGKSLTIQVGRPDVSGTVQPFSYTGCKFTSWELSNEVDGVLMLKLDVDGQDETTAQTLAAASYASGDELLYFSGGAVTIGGVAYDLSKISFTGGNGLKNDRYFIRSDTKKKEQLPAGLIDLGVTFESEFMDLTAYNRFVNGTTATLVGTWTGSIIEAALRYSVTVTLDTVRFDGDTPAVSGPDILTQPMKGKALYDGTDEPVKIEYQTTDTAS